MEKCMLKLLNWKGREGDCYEWWKIKLRVNWCFVEGGKWRWGNVSFCIRSRKVREILRVWF